MRLQCTNSFRLIMPYAIIKTGGKQYRVESGRTYKLPSLAGEQGGKIELNEVVLGNNGNTGHTGVPIIRGAKGPGDLARPGPAATSRVCYLTRPTHPPTHRG